MALALRPYPCCLSDTCCMPGASSFWHSLLGDGGAQRWLPLLGHRAQLSQVGRLHRWRNVVCSVRGHATSAEASPPPGRKWLLVVESPAKAKTIGVYLGTGYEVLATYGHVRDLNPNRGSVDPDDGFRLKWEVPDRAQPRLAQLARAAKESRGVLLATDPDREGEAIAWHVTEALQEMGAITAATPLHRICFHEITSAAVKTAVQHPRPVSADLVSAYLARRAMDYLMGYDLSPVLWRKLPGSRSAGRVQSVALRILCERELLRERHVAVEYWSVKAALAGGGVGFEASLTHVEGKRLGPHALTSCQVADDVSERVARADLAVSALKRKSSQRSPEAPFKTSSLQQEAASKLGMGGSRTMMLAQKLYEGVDMGGGVASGLITYMRTDSTQVSEWAVDHLRTFAKHRYGSAYVPDGPRQYKSKAKNAQEAHEAIRPTDANLLPSALEGLVDKDAQRVYALIWARAVSSQMSNAVMCQVAVDVEGEGGGLKLHASASSIEFEGFLATRQDAHALGVSLADEEEAEKDKKGFQDALGSLKEGVPVACTVVDPRQHFTEPPPRYSEGTLVKELEELGVGRPSTYAPIIKTLEVSAFLVRFFSRYVDPTFTSHMENEVRTAGTPSSSSTSSSTPSGGGEGVAQLDEVAAGHGEWKEVVGEFWGGFHSAVGEALKLDPGQVEINLDNALKLLGAIPSWVHPEGGAIWIGKEKREAVEGKKAARGFRFFLFDDTAKATVLKSKVLGLSLDEAYNLLHNSKKSQPKPVDKDTESVQTNGEAGWGSTGGGGREMGRKGEGGVAGVGGKGDGLGDGKRRGGGKGEVEVEISDDLKDFLGGVKYSTRKEATRAIWSYVKEHDLQDPTDGRKAVLDKRLKYLLGVERTSYIAIGSLLRRHLA